MYNSDELYKMLVDGKSADEISKSFTEAINTALQKKKERDLAAKKNAEVKTKKIKLVNDIMGLVCDLFSTYYPEVEMEKFIKELTPEDLVDSLDEAYDAVKEVGKNIDSLDDFLRRNGLA